MIERELLKKKFIAKHDLSNAKFERLRSDVSNRIYDRVYCADGRTVILMDAPPILENSFAFCQMSRFLLKNGFSSPEIIAEDHENGFLLIEDFGDYSFNKILSGKTDISSEFNEERLYDKAFDVLIKLHKTTPPEHLTVYDESMMIKESSLFIEWYVSVLNDAKISKKLQEEFQLIWKHLIKLTKCFAKTTVLRDYHSDNLHWLMDRNGVQRVGLLDFQGAVIGSPVYDIVSILEDARRDVSEDVSNKMIAKYLKEFPQYNYKDFLASCRILGAQRNLKIIGIFTRQAAKEKKPFYLSMLPRVWKYVSCNLQHPLLLPLKQWVDIALPNHLKDSAKQQKGSQKILV